MRNDKIAKRGIGFWVVIIPMVFLSLLSCAPLQPQIAQMPTQRETRTIKILKNDFEGKAISVREIYDEISNIFTTTGDHGERVSYPQFYNSGASSESIQGVQVKADNNKITVIYYNGKRANFAGRGHTETVTTDVVAEFPVDIADDGINYIVKLGYPSLLNIIPRRGSLTDHMAPRQYADTLKIAKDIDLKFESVKTLSIKKIYVIKGESVSKYGTDSIFANFARMLGKGSGTKANDLEKRDTFQYKFNDQTLSLQVSVMPYRNGSKVSYRLNFPYTVSTTISVTQDNIDKVNQSIEKIVND